MRNNVLIIGANGGIGTAIKEKLNQKFNLLYPSSSELDVTSELSIESYFNNLKIDHVYGLIYSAGINRTARFYELSVEDFEESISINVTGLIKVIKKLDEKFVDYKTKICAISSLYGTISRLKRSPYATSKHALNGLIKSLALEYASRGILVNSVSPGFIETNLTFKNNSKDQIQELIKNIPLGKLGKPYEVAHLVEFLILESNTYITGQNFTIDGGYMIGGFQNG